MLRDGGLRNGERVQHLLSDVPGFCSRLYFAEICLLEDFCQRSKYNALDCSVEARAAVAAGKRYFSSRNQLIFVPLALCPPHLPGFSVGKIEKCLFC